AHPSARLLVQRRARGLLLAPLAATTLGLGVVGDVWWGDSQVEHVKGLQRAAIASFTHGDVLAQELEGREVIVLNSNSQAVGLYGEFVLAAYGQPVPASWRTLAMGEFAMFASRPRDNVLELAAIQGAWLRGPNELFFRREDRHVVTGDVFEYPSLRVEVLADEDGDPTKVRMTFPHSLEDPRYLFLSSTPKGLRKWAVPAVGKPGVVPLPRMPVVEEGESRIDGD
ncbi:MAG: hypothetical protein HC927_03950, partial [Deltaproteobacteria bacterium]|nr:hypothetical protein [Deltaproteobacteria bacterium]